MDAACADAPLRCTCAVCLPYCQRTYDTKVARLVFLASVEKMRYCLLRIKNPPCVTVVSPPHASRSLRSSHSRNTLVPITQDDEDLSPSVSTSTASTTSATPTEADLRIASAVYNISANVSTASIIPSPAAAAPSPPCGDASYRQDVPFIRFVPSANAGPSSNRVRAHTSSPVPGHHRVQQTYITPEAPGSAPPLLPQEPHGSSSPLELRTQVGMTSHEPSQPPPTHPVTALPAAPERLYPSIAEPAVQICHHREGTGSATVPPTRSPEPPQYPAVAVVEASAPPVAGPSAPVLESSPVTFPGCPTAEYIESEADLLVPIDWERYRESRGIRGGGQTVWYRTSGPFAIVQPPASLSANTDDIYIHRDVGTSRVKIWVLNCTHIWVPARAGDPQPSNNSRRLSVSKSGVRTRRFLLTTGTP